jgi:hypothetical protein
MPTTTNVVRLTAFMISPAADASWSDGGYRSFPHADLQAHLPAESLPELAGISAAKRRVGG